MLVLADDPKADHGGREFQHTAVALISVPPEHRTVDRVDGTATLWAGLLRGDSLTARIELPEHHLRPGLQAIPSLRAKSALETGRLQRIARADVHFEPSPVLRSPGEPSEVHRVSVLVERVFPRMWHLAFRFWACSQLNQPATTGPRAPPSMSVPRVFPRSGRATAAESLRARTGRRAWRRQPRRSCPYRRRLR